MRVAIKEESLPLIIEADIVQVRHKVRQWAEELKFTLVEQTKIVTAASELARNTIIHGGGGAVHCAMLRDGVRSGLQLMFEDRGPGIRDIALALQDGYTTGNGLGLGLGGAKRLVGEFDIWSREGEGTRVTIARWK